MGRISLLANLDVLLTVVIVSVWVILISDNPLSVQLGLAVGLTSGIVFYFLKQKRERIVRGWRLPSASMPIILVGFLLALVFVLSAPRYSLIYVSWLGIPATDWISFIVVYAFLTFIPGFVMIALIDTKNRLSFLPRVVLSLLLSMFLSSQLVYVSKLVSLDFMSTNFVFLAVNGILVGLYLVRFFRLRHSPEYGESEGLNVTFLLALGLLVVLSVILVYVQQFVYAPFIRGDNWNYLATSNYIDKGSVSLAAVGKFYNIKTMSVYELYNLGLFTFSGFPSANAMMINSLVIASIVPLAFYVMVSQYIKSKKVSVLSTFIYVAVSGFGWIPFVVQKIGLGFQQYLPQELNLVLIDSASRVLNDISQPQGGIPEGFKTYILALLSVIMLVYLFKSKLATKARMTLIGIVVAFAFLAHIETTLAFFFVFLPAFAILSKRLPDLKKNIVALALGMIVTIVIGLSSPAFLIVPFELNYWLVFVVLGVLFAFTYLRGPLRARLPRLRNMLGSYRLMVVFVCYLYLLCIIVLFSYGYARMDYGDAVVYQGFTFPWYYYPVSFGVAGALLLVGLFGDFGKNRSLSFFLLAAIFTVVLGVAVSYLNSNSFNTGTKEWRLVYRILPVATSVFAGWGFLKIIWFLKTSITKGTCSFVLKSRRMIRVRWLSCLVFTLVVIIGIPSTVIASEYWMSSKATPFGPADGTASGVELANFVKVNVPITSRVATLGDTANAVVKLAGGTTAVPALYPDFLLSNRPETISLVSSDIGFVCIDKAINFESLNRDFVEYFPLMFNNSDFLVYKVPFLESPSESSLGYLAPVRYDNDSLASYLTVASLNSSYELVKDDFQDKSVLILPTDFSEATFGIQSSTLTTWLVDGGKLVVLGGQREMFNELGLTLSVDKSEVNGFLSESGTFSLEPVNLRSVVLDSDVNVLAYFSFNGRNVSPFIVEKRVDNGVVFYVYTDCIYEFIQNGIVDANILSEIAPYIRNILQEAGVQFPAFSGNFSRYPLGSRWMGEYGVYGEQNFLMQGNISTSSIFSGSYLLEKQPIVAKTVILTDNYEQKILKNKVVDTINVVGEASIIVESNFCNVSANSKGTLVPSYVLLKYGASSIKITANSGTVVNIQLFDGNYSLVDGSIEIVSKSSQITLHKPNFEVDGKINFAQISLPTTSSAWTFNVRLDGRLDFGIDYNDGKYVFVKHFVGNYNEVVRSNAIVDIVPLSDILFSLPNVFVTASMIVLAILTFRKSKRHDIPH